jgi:putative protein kinase ArgK-like GTPase of G3E family
LTDEVSQFKNQQPLQNCGASKAWKPAMDAIHKWTRTPEAGTPELTGTGGSGKSSLVDELVRRFLNS